MGGIWLPPGDLLTRNSGLSTLFFEEDWISGNSSSSTNGQGGWQLNGGSNSLLTGQVNHPGILRRDTGAVINTLASVNPYVGISTLWASADFDVRWIVRNNFNDVDTQLRIGSFSSFIGNPPTDGAYFEKLGPDTNWFCVARSGGVQTRIDSGVPVGLDWTHFFISHRSSGANFYINGTLVGTITTNLSVSQQPATQIVNLAAASKTLDHDYASFTVFNLSR